MGRDNQVRMRPAWWNVTRNTQRIGAAIGESEGYGGGENSSSSFGIDMSITGS